MCTDSVAIENSTHSVAHGIRVPSSFLPQFPYLSPIEFDLKHSLCALTPAETGW